MASPMRPMRLMTSLRRFSRCAAVWRAPKNSHAPAAMSRIARRLRIATSVAPEDDRRLAPSRNIEGYSSLQDGSAGDRRFLEHLGIILQELIEPLIGERVVEQHIEHFERHGGDVGPGGGRVNDVRG